MRVKTLISTLLASLAVTLTASAAKQPNIVLIMADDVSPEMYGCYGAADAKTPNLDRMASEGVQFNTAWGAALCAPARAQIMTGCYGTTTGLYSNGFGLPMEDGSNNLFHYYPSFAKLLQKQGYRTAVAGKWHIGGAEEPHEKVVGFDEYCLWEGPKQLAALPGKPEHTGLWEDSKTPSRFWHPCVIQNGELLATKPTDFGPALYTKFLCEFMERSVKEGKPFLAYYPMVSPHGTRTGQPTSPLYGEPGDLGSKQATDGDARFRALNDYIDILIGRLQQQVKDLGVLDNTIFIFCADNGTAVIAKSRGTERGCHVPFIAWGAGIEKRGLTLEICDLTDILPTLVDYAGGTLPEGHRFDGKSLKPFLTGESDTHRDTIMGVIGGTRLARSRTHMLEVVNDLLGVPEGRFYYTGNNAGGKDYARAESNPEHKDALVQLWAVLDAHPGLTEDHPYFQVSRAAGWLKSYRDPKAAAKHLHNHKDYQTYDETLPID